MEFLKRQHKYRRINLHFFLLSSVLIVTFYFFITPNTFYGQEPSISPSQTSKSLNELCNKFETDKCSNLHNYIEIYENYFSSLRYSTEKLFEIGILSGASHLMWKEYFHKAEIYGIDIEDCSRLEKEGIHTFIADQANRDDLKKFITTYGEGYDIIIDDGGHTMEQQQVSFGYLFKYLKPGGLYIIEDVHTSLKKYYEGFGVKEDGSNNTFRLIVHYMATGDIKSEYMSQQEINYLRLNIAYCDLIYISTSMHSMMCIIKKRDN